MKNQQLKGSLIILTASIIWGSTFIFQRKATEFVDAFTFNFFRSVIAVICLSTLSLITKNKIQHDTPKSKTKMYIFAALTGISVFLGFIFQQLGLKTITASKSGFLSALYILMVPIIALVIGKKVKPFIIACAVLALFGSYFLSTTGGLDFNLGELYTILSAFFFSLQIIFVDQINQYMNPFKFATIQFAFVLVLSGIMMLLTEEVDLNNVWKAFPSIIYAGFLSSTIGFSCQIIGQKYAEPSIASLLMGLESVFALIFGTIFLHETMTSREIIGSVLIFSAVVLSEIPFEKWIKKNKKQNTI